MQILMQRDRDRHPRLSPLSAPTADLLFQAGLLAGLGPQIKPLLTSQEVEPLSAPPLQKSCIAASNSLLLSIVAPGDRSLRIARRIPGTHRWYRTDFRPGAASTAAPTSWLTEFFFDQTSLPWQTALTLAQSLHAEPQLRHYHSLLGANGRLLSCSHRADAEQSGGWVTWQLDRHCPPSEALAACGAEGTWAIAAQHFQTLLGRSVSRYCRPWSLAFELSSHQPRFRLGTTVWARQPESPDKHHRLAATVEQLGGDRCFAEALYKLVAAAQPIGLAHRVGRAAEIEFCGDQIVGMEFFLCAATQ